MDGNTEPQILILPRDTDAQRSYSGQILTFCEGRRHIRYFQQKLTYAFLILDVLLLIMWTNMNFDRTKPLV